MKLLLKVNLVLVIVFLIGLAASYKVANALLLENARLEIQENARIMMETSSLPSGSAESNTALSGSRPVACVIRARLTARESISMPT